LGKTQPGADSPLRKSPLFFLILIVLLLFKTKAKKSLLYENIFGTYNNIFGLKTSSAETAFVQKMAKKERIFKYVVFEESQFPQEKIRAYGEEHTDLFAEHNLLMLTFNSQEDANKTIKTNGIRKNTDTNCLRTKSSGRLFRR